MHSLRSRLVVVWLLSLAASVAVGLILVGLYRQSTGAQLDRAAAAVAEACDAIGDRFAFYATGWAGPLPAPGTAEAASFAADLDQLLAVALAGRAGVAGGLWLDDAPLASTMPLASDLRATIAALAAEDERTAGTRIVANGETLLVQACAAAGPLPGLDAFAVARVPDAPGQERLRIGLAGLFALVLGVSLLLGWAAIAWSRSVGRIEQALAAESRGALPHVEPTGEHDLDRVVAALNRAGAGLAAAQHRAAQAERLAALGRIAAGVAHEVRNPVAAMRLRAENARAGDPARLRPALEAVLEQVARLERLTGELLTMTQSREIHPAPVDLAPFLAAVAADHGATAAAPPATIMLDAALLRRALDELLSNAARHAPGTATVRAAIADGRLAIEIADRGPGVPDALRETLFEPFVSGRPDGTGLGLAIAREMVEAMGGTLVLADAGPGAVFRLELPCPQ
jgi:signal transduction histidine kinase